ncbi:methyltransferase [Allorhizobium sp. BGMRC 0089]|uniref:class I SAM-dependent methyltransferase n=1 Tax=Allorhizobium sonneratiae TaxID=2934936 RepID=UPI002033380A|nr:methyltransferase [Allorhizobium sonneratiae]MCM2293421.1 methyltransferase [Allorhizobium sonneratiae]
MTATRDPEGFIRANTALIAPPHVPEISLHLASEVHDLWLKTEEELADIGLPPPFWAFAWAGGQGLARHILNHPDLVRGKRVIDFASGSGLVGIAAKMAGAAHVTAVDIDPFSATAIRLNAQANRVEIDCRSEDLIGQRPDADLLLAGDVFYDKSFSDRLKDWFTALTRDHILVIVGDPGRSYCPKEQMTELGSYAVPVTRVLEDAEVKHTTVWQFTG